MLNQGLNDESVKLNMGLSEVGKYINYLEGLSPPSITCFGTNLRMCFRVHSMKRL